MQISSCSFNFVCSCIALQKHNLDLLVHLVQNSCTFSYTVKWHHGTSHTAWPHPPALTVAAAGVWLCNPTSPYNKRVIQQRAEKSHPMSLHWLSSFDLKKTTRSLMLVGCLFVAPFPVPESAYACIGYSATEGQELSSLRQPSPLQGWDMLPAPT